MTSSTKPKTAPRPNHWRTFTAAMAVGATVFVTGCATLPGSSSPEAISSYAPTPHLDDVVAPEDDQAPDLLLRDFFAASSHPVGDYKAARKFLTENQAEHWNPTKQTMILDRIVINSDGAAEDGKITYRIRGNVVGTLGTGGVFTPEYTAYETTFRFEQTDGQWRIANLRDGVIMDRNDFASAYDAHPIYFVDPQGKALVPDRRWVYIRQQSMGASLVSLLSAGPQSSLKKGVTTRIAEGATVQARKDDDGIFTVEFSGLTDLGQSDRQILAAQVVWTLAAGDIHGPYKLLADGAPLSEDVGDTWHIDDVSQYDPRISVAEPLRAVVDGQVRELDDDGVTSSELDGWLDHDYIESLAVAPQDSVLAAVTGRGDEPRSLKIGKKEEKPQTVLKAKSFTRPTWGVDSNTAYTVADGEKLIEITRTGATQNVSYNEINSDVLDELDSKARISMFQLSADGVRAVMLINGRVYVAILEQDDDGETQLSEPQEIGYQMGDTAVSADWQIDGTVLVGTRANDAPVWSLAADGSVANQESSRNLTAPVVAITSNERSIYATDGRALMMLNRSDADPKFWREVPSIQGERAIPILPG